MPKGERLQTAKILHSSYHINAHENPIFLCASCHKQFDSNDRNASIILLPTDLKTPTKWEKKNGQRMKDLTINLGGKDYRFYCLDDSLTAASDITSTSVKCVANKAAIVVKAAFSIIQVYIGGEGVPWKVVKKVNKLPPVLPNPAVPVAGKVCDVVKARFTGSADFSAW